MRTALLPQSILFVALVASAALARDGRDEPSVRRILLTEHPDDATHRVYVKGQVVTTLRFEKPVDPNKTRMIGWEGRLEPLAVVRNKVVLEPIHDLSDDEGIPLVVTLSNGQEVPFLLRPSDTQGWSFMDQQVDVFENRESYAAMHAALMVALKKNDTLTDENQRYRKEETSQDHALAALLASGAIEQTPFRLADRFAGKDAAVDVDIKIYGGKGKAAVVFKIKNLDSKQPWSMQKAELLTKATYHDRAVAVRATVREILPGDSGVVALVADGGAFVEEGKPTSLILHIYRHDGLRQSMVELDPSLVKR